MKKRLIRIGIGLIIYIAALLLPDYPWQLKLGAFVAAYAVVGYRVVWKAIRGLFRGQMLDENFLMSVASIGAFFVGEYPEAVAVMLFYQIGETFEDYAVGKSRKSISALMDIRPDVANLKTLDGLKEVSPEEVRPGDIIVIKPGEKIPLDGNIIEGSSSINTAALTGESLPKDVTKGDSILSGCVNLKGVLTVEVTKPFGESTVSKILDLVENAAAKKSKTESFISRFALIYTPVVVGAAVLIAVIPPVIIEGALWSDWIYRALNFLVVSCPCALVISVPLSFFGGIGGASKSGVLIKGSNYLEAMSKVEWVVMDKTGTLTEGVFHVEEILPEEGYNKDEVLEYAAMAESDSNHPIAVSLKEEYGKEINRNLITETYELTGKGICATINGHEIAAGNKRLMEEKTSFAGNLKEYSLGTQVYVAVDGQYAGCILLADKIKDDAYKAVKSLNQENVKTAMLTGDSEAVGRAAADKLGISKVYAGLMPADKVSIVEKIMEDISAKKKIAFVGDGINDAPVLARADVGIAMGALGSDAAIEAADMVIMEDKPSKIADMMRLSRKTMKIVKENIVFALGVKALVLVLSAFGLAGLWSAVFADVGVSVIAILNAMRCLTFKAE
mgnify:CR=1 FL=1